MSAIHARIGDADREQDVGSTRASSAVTAILESSTVPGPAADEQLLVTRSHSLPANTRGRSVIERRLAEIQEQIANGERQLAQQRQFIAELENNNCSADHARYLLAGLELLQAARADSLQWFLRKRKSILRGES